MELLFNSIKKDKEILKTLPLLIMEGYNKEVQMKYVYRFNKLIDGEILAFESPNMQVIRDIIKYANNSKQNVVIFIDNAGAMAESSQAALLKLTEEPPSHVYIIMTVYNRDELIVPLLTRAWIYRYANNLVDGDTPEEKYAIKIRDQIATKEVFEVLNFNKHLKLKENDKNDLDVDLFLLHLKKIYANNLKIIWIIREAQEALAIPGVNKNLTLDNMYFLIWEEINKDKMRI